MRQIPFTTAVLISGSEVDNIATQMEEAAQALEESAALNMSLLKDWMASQSKLRELSGIIVTQSESCQQIMQINEILAETISKLREISDVVYMDEILESMSARLLEFDAA